MSDERAPEESVVELDTAERLPDYGDVEAAAERLLGVARRTPVATSTTFDELTGCRALFKCENLQRTGSFKFRGAYNALSCLSAAQRRRGIVTFSSGNHAQAVALAARLLEVPATIVMPEDAPRVKLEATRGYGAEIVLYDRQKATREELANEIAAERGLPVVPAYDHPDVIAGQGTAAKELIEDVGPLDWLLTPCGGAGLLSGSALAARHLSPNCRIVGVEPELADDATRSFHTGTLHTVHNPPTVADGARTPYLGSLTFPLIRENVDDMVTVSDEAILRAMFFVWQRLKQVIEPTGALAIAALLERAITADGRVGVVFSGGNVDLSNVGEWWESVGGV